jgi:hypothetical protein
VTGVLLGSLALALVGLTGWIASSSLGVRSLPERVLASYVLAYAEIVCVTLFLSLFDALTRDALIAALAMVFAGALGVRLLAGAPRGHQRSLPSLPPGSWGRPVGVLAALVAAAFVYVLALVLSTPPNGWDQLNYHLARAALWIQAERVGYVDAAYDGRINAYPPHGEIGLAFALDVTRNEVFAATVQLIAALVCGVGVFALARRQRFGRREAAFGALLFLALPIVLLQASSTKNDVVVASFLVVAAVFVLGDSRRALGLAALATALAVGAKFTSFYGVVVLLALAVLSEPRARRGARVVALVAGTVVGLYWYVVNQVETGMPLGDTSGIPGLTAPLQPRENLVAAVGLVVDWLDVSGARGADLWLYLVAALLTAGVIALAARRRGVSGTRAALIAGCVVGAPVVLYTLASEVGRPLLTGTYDLLGEPVAYIPPDEDPNSSPRLASDTGSWFGPVGLVLAVGVGVAGIVLTRRGALPRIAVVCAVAPLVWTAMVAASLTYHPWQGRFFIFPVALSASLWGLALRVPAAAWGVTVASGLTMLLSLVHYYEKPSGLRLLERGATPSVWRMDRWQVQSQHDPSIGPVLQFLDDEVPPTDSLALALGVNDFGFPAFGSRLERRIALVPFGSSARDVGTDWLLANPERAAAIDASCWAPAFRSDAGTVFRRLADACVP